MILHIPHSSTYIPQEYKFIKKDISDDIFRMTDWYTDELFFHRNSDRIVFDTSRLICDVERFVKDDPMEKYGMGICYQNDSYGNPMREISSDEQTEIIEKYYMPHHSKLTRSVSQTLSMFDRAVIVDCHSFNDHPMPHNPYDKPRPDICIGVDDYHTPQILVDALIDYMKTNNISYKINEPFSGSIVPQMYYQKNKSVWSVMIEVNKRLYMDGADKSDNFDNCCNLVRNLLNIVNTVDKDYEDI